MYLDGMPLTWAVLCSGCELRERLVTVPGECIGGLMSSGRLSAIADIEVTTSRGGYRSLS
jgi:hypothetical protein